MNYFLLLVIVGVCGGAYYTYSTDHEEITTLQQQVNDLTAQLNAAGPANASRATPALAPAVTGVFPPTPMKSINPLAPTPPPAAPAAVVITPPPAVTPAKVPAHIAQPDHLNAIDAAANAAVAASSGSSIGTVTTLDRKTYTNCKVLKVEKDGVTFSHDDGITKILYPMMPPDVQKEFGYTPEAAVAQTEAEIRAAQEAAAASNTAPAAP